MSKKPMSYEYKGVPYREVGGLYYVELDGNVLEFDAEASVKRAITRSLKNNAPEEPPPAKEEKAKDETPKSATRSDGNVTVIHLPMKESGRPQGKSSGILFTNGEAILPSSSQYSPDRAVQVVADWSFVS